MNMQTPQRRITRKTPQALTPAARLPFRREVVCTKADEAAAAMSPKEWLAEHKELIHQAENLVSAQLAHPREHTALEIREQVYAAMSAGLGKGGVSEKAQSKSVLLLGERGSGKSHVVEACLSRFAEENRALGQAPVILRAYGGRYSSEAECVRHLASQVAGQLASAPQASTSFEVCMEWLRSVLKESFLRTTAVVIVLEHFEHFCSKARQSLLYNLFELAQEVNVPLSIIGTSHKSDVISCLEKRIRSRFNMISVNNVWPRTVEELVKMLMAKFRLAPDCGLPRTFLKQFHRHLEACLTSYSIAVWRDELEVGRPPSWFMWQCTPLLSFMRHVIGDGDACEAPSKRQRLVQGGLPSADESVRQDQMRRVILDGLNEQEHIVLLAMYILRCKGGCRSRTAAAVLEEIRTIHEGSGFMVAFKPGRYELAFNGLLESKLLKAISPSSDMPLRFMACVSTQDDMYGQFLKDIDQRIRSSSVDRGGWNPLTMLPHPVIQWALLRREEI